MMDTAFFGDLLQTIADRGRALVGLSRGDGGARRDLAVLCDALLSGRGEASGVALAREILAQYQALPPEERLGFLRMLAIGYGPDRERLDSAIKAYQAKPEGRSVIELHMAAEPRRQELIRRLNLAPGGTAALVRVREEALRNAKAIPGFEAMDADFTHLFSSWFNRGFLVLRRIDWSTPANILQKIIQYEAVHAIRDWDDLRRRLEPPDRRCFAFFHPQLTDDPLIFVEVALTADMAASISEVLTEERKPITADQATSAVFYSISNCQEGLRGISFGNFLIKQVVEELSREIPTLRTFVTLSPVPGFAAWLAQARRESDTEFLSVEDRRALSLLDDPRWHADPAKSEQVMPALLAAASQYFLKAKQPNGKPVDPVARFHLGNGARLERINPLADLSPKGLKQSHGLMVNYLYDLKHIERNHEAFVGEGRIAASSSVRKLLKEPARIQARPRAGSAIGDS
ncbi:malonyl-CoA decarboxylase [Azospirillum rugosum]|uniref:Malonyl-CoA decarboxylase n=1 Tax=Azospirillum rugosum TaxID=416170 RepID=A0ABS4SVU2_9PROT|nr:malonyl-CoA decarboxylase [Azospirillum rugosum]MBP2296685.1 malonyl-CoA decarboxylase [Azospirillum rugosum]MDQ0530502.1 malonyl-CoA decarboxylase [Azospirillum rugosum]